MAHKPALSGPGAEGAGSITGSSEPQCAVHERSLRWKPDKSATGKGCRYIEKLADVDKQALKN